MGEFLTGLRANTATFTRQRSNLLLLVILPVVLVEGFGRAMASFPSLPMMETLPASQGRLLGALFATAFITGIVGLSQVISARQADQRLVETGYPFSTMLMTRLATVVCSCLLISAVSYLVLQSTVTVAAPVTAYLALLLSGTSYGLLGVLIGALVPDELAGSLLIVFVADIDGFLGATLSNPPPLLEWFPLYHPKQVFESAVMTGTVSPRPLVTAIGYAVVLGVLVFVTFTRTLGRGA